MNLCRWASQLNPAAIQETRMIEEADIQWVWQSNVSKSRNRLFGSVVATVYLRQTHDNDLPFVSQSLESQDLIRHARIEPLLIQYLQIIDDHEHLRRRGRKASSNVVGTDLIRIIDQELVRETGQDRMPLRPG